MFRIGNYTEMKRDDGRGHPGVERSREWLLKNPRLLGVGGGRRVMKGSSERARMIAQFHGHRWEIQTEPAAFVPFCGAGEMLSG